MGGHEECYELVRHLKRSIQPSALSPQPISPLVPSRETLTPFAGRLVRVVMDWLAVAVGKHLARDSEPILDFWFEPSLCAGGEDQVGVWLGSYK